MNVRFKNNISAAMLCALAYILMLISKMIPAVSGFLQYDLKDVAIVTGGFILGPLYALVITLIVTVIELVTVSDTGLIGLVMNFISTGAFCVTASLIYQKKKTMKGAFIGLFLGTIILTIMMALWNYYITPMYMKMPREAIEPMIPTVFIPFNLIKGFLNSGVTLLIYRPVTDGLKRAGLMERKENTPSKKTFSPALIAGIIILLVFIPLLLLMM
ncbi:MAG: ECF transporter S component [Ruminococcaceae bacterium]|nr:ECF transporter S component [Oscillospiraceae bacterium]